MKLHKNNDKPATPVHEIQKWGTEKQVSDFINDVWPVNWTKKSFLYYVSECGLVAMVTSGMDCDCVEWENEVWLVPIEKAEETELSEYEWAEGPLDVKWLKPSEAKKLTKKSRDRIAAAHEDGHPWSV